MAFEFISRFISFIISVFSIILLYLSTIIPGFEKSSTEYRPGENPSKINFRTRNPFGNLFRSANGGPNRSDFQRDQRQNFYTQRRDNSGGQKGPGLNCLGMGGG